MPHTPKIATCCYCGSRAALVLTGKTRQELACATCGAPLHELKMLRLDARGDRELVPRSAIRSSKSRGKGHRASKKSTKPKKRSVKSRFKRAFWDVAEDVLDDVFDDVLDIFD